MRRVDDRDTARAEHLEAVARRDERSRVLVETDADGERIVGQRRQQAAEAVALAEVLVDDELVGQPETRRHGHHVRTWCTALFAAGNHVF